MRDLMKDANVLESTLKKSDILSCQGTYGIVYGVSNTWLDSEKNENNIDAIIQAIKPRYMQIIIHEYYLLHKANNVKKRHPLDTYHENKRIRLSKKPREL